MKTPMQILLEKIENGDFLHPKVIGEFIKYNLLEKEKEVMCEFADDYQRNCLQKSADDYYNETFNTKEK